MQWDGGVILMGFLKEGHLPSHLGMKKNSMCGWGGQSGKMGSDGLWDSQMPILIVKAKKFEQVDGNQ